MKHLFKNLVFDGYEGLSFFLDDHKLDHQFIIFHTIPFQLLGIYKIKTHFRN